MPAMQISEIVLRFSITTTGAEFVLGSVYRGSWFKTGSLL